MKKRRSEEMEKLRNPDILKLLKQIGRCRLGTSWHGPPLPAPTFHGCSSNIHAQEAICSWVVFRAPALIQWCPSNIHAQEVLLSWVVFRAPTLLIQWCSSIFHAQEVFFPGLCFGLPQKQMVQLGKSISWNPYHHVKMVPDDWSLIDQNNVKPFIQTPFKNWRLGASNQEMVSFVPLVRACLRARALVA